MSIISYRNLRNISSFTISSMMLNFANLVSGFIIYKWVDPAHMGIWQTMILIETYSSFLRFGVINGMNRELPYQVGQGNVDTAHSYAATAQAYNLGISAVFFIVFLTGFLAFPRPDGWSVPLIAICCVITVHYYQSYLLGTFRAHADFAKLSRLQLLDSGLKLCSVALVYWFGFTGLCLRAAGVVLLMTLITHLVRPIRIKPKFDFSVFKTLNRTGLPIMLGSYLYGIAFSLPRVILLKQGSTELLGLYAPVLTMLGALSTISDSIGTYYYPRMSHALGVSGENKKSFMSTSIRVHVGIMILSIPAIVAGWFLIPPIVENFLPKYRGSLSVIHIGLFISLFLGTKFGFTILATLKSWRYMTTYIALFLVLQAAFPIIFLNFYEPLDAVTWGQLFAALCMFPVSLCTNYLAIRSYELQPDLVGMRMPV